MLTGDKKNCLLFILQHRGIPYCNIPCYSLLFGPGGYGRGGTESYQYFADEKLTPAELDALRYTAVCTIIQISLIVP